MTNADVHQQTAVEGLSTGLQPDIKPEKPSRRYDVDFQGLDGFVTADRKQILFGVTGRVSSGEVLAIMGPSGSGKSSLLNALCGRFEGQLQGTLLFNGRPGTKAELKKLMAYVTQDDVLPQKLTVNETLLYHARLRTGESVDIAQKRVDRVIAQLGLQHCKNTAINPKSGRGVSGGERKRAAIACELIGEPRILFLDEPTSGLDSYTAGQLMQLLQTLARSGQAIACSIHQPSSALVARFDRLLLLAHGRIVYHGANNQAVDYFRQQGYPCPEFWNPADFFLELLSDATPEADTQEADGDSSDDAVSFTEAQIQLTGAWANREHRVGLDQPAVQDQSVVEDQFAVSYLAAFLILLSRGYKIKTEVVMTKENLIQYGLLAVFSGLLYFNQDFTEDAVFNRRSALWFCCIYFGFSPMFVAAMQFPSDRPLIEKERQAGLYPLSAYFLANTVAVLSLYLVWPTLFAIVVYWMANLNPEFLPFLGFWMLLLLTTICSFMIGSVFGMWFKDLVLGLTVMGTYMLVGMLAGGFVIDDIPVFVAWLSYTSFTMYPLQAMMALEFTNSKVFSCDPVSSDFDQCQTASTFTGQAVRDEFHVDMPVWQAVAILIGISLLAGLLAFMGLRHSIQKTRLEIKQADESSPQASEETKHVVESKFKPHDHTSTSEIQLREQV